MYFDGAVNQFKVGVTYFNGAVNQFKAGVRIILLTPEGEVVPITKKLAFRVINIEA